MGKFLWIIGCLVLVLLGGGWVYLIVRPSMGEAPSGDRLSRIEQSTHYKDGKFTNETEIRELVGSMLKMVWSHFFGKNRNPETSLPSVKIDASSFSVPPNNLQAVWLGHSSFIIDIDGKRLLLDPVFEYAAPISWFANRFQPTPIKREELPFIDVILISHDHYDHLEISTVKYFVRKGTTFIVPLGVGQYLEDWGVALDRIIELDWWQEYRLANLEIVCTPASHFSGRGFRDKNKTLWASWTVKSDKHRFFYSGDTGWGPHFEEIGKRFGPFDFTFMKIGAYNKQWPDLHLFPEQAIDAHLAVKGQLMIPMHWGTFNLSVHSWDEPIKRTIFAASQKKAKVLAPRLGEVVQPNQYTEPVAWWKNMSNPEK